MRLFAFFAATNLIGAMLAAGELAHTMSIIVAMTGEAAGMFPRFLDACKALTKIIPMLDGI